MRYSKETQGWSKEPSIPNKQMRIDRLNEMESEEVIRYALRYSPSATQAAAVLEYEGIHDSR